ncbi:MAG: hypothetical protein MZW92_24270 [Comamonadaceae bacterium]|nr:hypothetical protein [Comamonadaceae bacterium]
MVPRLRGARPLRRPEPRHHRLRRVERRRHLGEDPAAGTRGSRAGQGRAGRLRLGRPDHPIGAARRLRLVDVLRRLRHQRGLLRRPGEGRAVRLLRRGAPLLLLALLIRPARAQTMLDQEERLVELHSLLVSLPAVQAPGALLPWQASLGLEVITIPTIDGTTGGKDQITASDQTQAFPRLRLALGLPLGGGWRAFAGAGYIPPLEVNGVTCHLAALEGGVAWATGALSVALRGQAVRAVSKSRSPVPTPATPSTPPCWAATCRSATASTPARCGSRPMPPWAASGWTASSASPATATR